MIAFPNTSNDYTVVLNATGVANSGITAAIPANTAVGDMLEITLHVNNNAASLAVTDSSGLLTQILSNTTDNGLYTVHTKVYYRIVDGTETSFPFAFGSSDTRDDAVIVRRVTGVNLASPIGSIAGLASTNSNTPISNSLTTTAAGSAVRFGAAYKNGNNFGGTDTNYPSGTTGLLARQSRANSSGVIFAQAYQSYPSPVATGTKSWTNLVNAAGYWLAFAYELTPVTGTIDTIDDPIVEGTSFNYTQSGMGTLSGITTDKTGVTVSGVTASSANLSGWTDGELYPDLPSAVQFEFTGSTGSALKSSNISAPAGYTKLTIASPLFIANTIPSAILAATGRTIATGDVFQHTTYGDLVITDDGDWEGDAGTFDLWLRVAAGADAGKMFYYAVTITEGGAVVVTGGLTSSGLASSGLTRVGLTSTGL